jgi:hypothetical protein
VWAGGRDWLRGGRISCGIGEQCVVAQEKDGE